CTPRRPRQGRPYYAAVDLIACRPDDQLISAARIYVDSRALTRDDAHRRRARTRKAIVDEHVRCENLHDVEATMATFGKDARYDDEPWADHRTGRDVLHRAHGALSDLAIEVNIGTSLPRVWCWR